MATRASYTPRGTEVDSPLLEYLCQAAWCFFKEGDPAAERWVHETARAILKGHRRPLGA